MNKKNGIELVEPSDNLRDAYLIKAEEYFDLIGKVFKARNDSQYSVDREVPDEFTS